MSQSSTQTVRILRPAATPESAGAMEETELELVSTMMLKSLLETRDEEHKRRLEEAARGKDGVLAQNLSSGRFEIISDEDLKAAIAAESASGRAADVVYEPLTERIDSADEELSLVSTMALRKMLSKDDAPDNGDELAIEIGNSFDPYNSA